MTHGANATSSLKGGEQPEAEALGDKHKRVDCVALAGGVGSHKHSQGIKLESNIAQTPEVAGTHLREPGATVSN